MDPAALSRLGNALTLNASVISNDGIPGVGYLSPLLDSIESPILSSVGTGDLLTYGGKETLRIEESSEPV